jgi:serine/threonine-protein kinase
MARSSKDYNVLLCVLAVRRGILGESAAREVLGVWLSNQEIPFRSLLLQAFRLRDEDLEALEMAARQLLKERQQAEVALPDDVDRDSLYFELNELVRTGLGATSLRAPKTVAHLPDSASEPPVALPAKPGFALTSSSSSVQLDPNRQGVLPLNLPGYQPVRLIGRGGMGIVYEARQVSLDRSVAVKMLLPGRPISGEDLERFRTEALAVARLRHPNIVQIYEVGEHQGHPFFAMELVTGITLEQRIRGGALPPGSAARLLLKIAMAVHFAHCQGVVHRDLKPSNILLEAGKAPKITDFGLAKLVDTHQELTRTGAVLGTPSYMAPEQANGLIHLIGPVTDVYALGAVLYEMLTGKPPHTGKTNLEILNKVRRVLPVPPSKLRPSVSRDLEAICLKCMEKDPASRYASALEVARDLRRLLRGEAIRAPVMGLAVPEMDSVPEPAAPPPLALESHPLILHIEPAILARAESVSKRLGIPLESLVGRALKSLLLLIGET